ncbi:hypothetical protein FQN54_008063 [Arachnomyces sp. PD_36]|nr:hypothetical protein FQN54_008063 [Arachnomyces sp. PD_36]
MLSNATSSRVPPEDRVDSASPSPSPSGRPSHTLAKFDIKTNFITRIRPYDPSAVGETSYDPTSFLPQPTSGSSENPNPSTDIEENPPTSTAATPEQSVTNTPGPNKLSTILPIVLTVVAVVAIAIIVGVYIARRRNKKRKAQRLSESARPETTEASVGLAEQPHSPGGRTAYVIKKPSSRFFDPPSQMSLESVRQQVKRGFYTPAKTRQRTDASFHPAISMTHYPTESHRPTDPAVSGPSSSYTVRDPTPRPPSPQRTVGGYESILSYYENSGGNTGTGGYEQIPDSPAYDEGRGLEQGPDRSYDLADGFEPVTTYGQGRSARLTPPNPHRGGNGQVHALEGIASAPRPVHGPTTVAPERHPQPRFPFSGTTSESSLNSEMRILAERFGPAGGREMGSTAGRPIAGDSMEHGFRGRLDALAMLEGKSRDVMGDEPGEASHQAPRPGTYEFLGGDGWRDASISDMSTYALQPDPLVIRKGRPSPPPSDLQPGPSETPQRTGYEEYMENPYGVGVPGGQQNAPGKETPPLHFEGSYENWVKAQREDHLERSAGRQYNPAGPGEIHYSRGEGSGTQPRRPLRPPAEVGDESGAGVVQDSHNPNQGTDHHPSPEWYKVVQDRLRTQSPDSNRLSPINSGTGNGKGVAGRGAEERYPYASPQGSEELGPDPPGENMSGFKLRKKASGRWKRLSGKLRRKEN